MRTEDVFLGWKQLRGQGATLVTADDTALALGTSTGNWANKPAVPAFTSGAYVCTPAVAVDIEDMTQGQIRTIEIIGYGTDTANQVCAWILYAYRREFSPACRVATGSAILGTMDVVTDPVTNAALTAFYVDTFGITTDYWGSVSVKDNADNSCSRLVFDLRGYKYLYMEVTPATSTCVSIGFAFSGV